MLVCAERNQQADSTIPADGRDRMAVEPHSREGFVVNPTGLRLHSRDLHKCKFVPRPVRLIGGFRD